MIKTNWVNVSSLDTFCEMKEVRGFNRVLIECYYNSKDGWPDHSDEQLKKAHSELVKIIYEAGYSLEDVKEYTGNL